MLLAIVWAIRGYQVGPDLTIASNRSDEALLLDILAPSDQISAGYRSYVIVDNSGRIFTGVLTSETAAGVTLRQPKAPKRGGERQAVSGAHHFAQGH